MIEIESGDSLVLKAKGMMRREDMEDARKWFKEAMGLDVKIIGPEYEIEGVERNG